MSASRPVIDMNPAQKTLMNMLNDLRNDLVDALKGDGIKDFENCNKLLSEVQSHVRALDILEALKGDTPLVRPAPLPRASMLGERAVESALRSA